MRALLKASRARYRPLLGLSTRASRRRTPCGRRSCSARRRPARHRAGAGGAMRIEGVILDVDGTLVDSNQAHVDAWAEALRAFGYETPQQRLRELIGMGGDQL